MSDTLKLRPGRPGLLVHDPVTGAVLPPEGALCPANQYWLRRVACGDAVVCVPAAEPEPESPAPTTRED